ncbi:uncharacterized protein DNG_02611 [Cephalotrichum gorgonifer]|uniref:Uncharacterized protein n=1 Tax=Cephalotrichum gorgonifer TaxID=2041049 RepID=A0AAE8MTI7_9PEZI|nr:uncharacterized protein DNG_02611 [Cephalotrichum gorgonifer]
MPSKEREVVDEDGRPREKHRRSKSERSKSERDPNKPRKSRSSKSKLTDSDVQSSSSRRHRRTKDSHGDEKRSSLTDPLPEESQSTFSITDRVSVPYPTFSKAHSKEAVHSREDLTRKSNPLTPEHTDLGSDPKPPKPIDSTTSERKSSTSKKSSRPPTPPDTELTGSQRKSRSGAGTPDSAKKERPKSRVSSVSGTASRAASKSRLGRTESGVSSQATYVKAPKAATSREHLYPDEGLRRSSSRTSRSDRGSRLAEQVDGDFSPPSISDSSPKTPTQAQSFPIPPPPPPVFPGGKDFPAYSHNPPVVIPSDTPGFAFNTPSATPGLVFGTPAPPPPPPPPPLAFQEPPRVDYLLQNGGLPQRVPKSFLSVLPRNTGTRPSNQPLAGPETLFSPFFTLLEQYSTVLAKHGSIAVATGHRSVARRLLDRLEHVFSRDLPAQGCSCVICDRSEVEHSGLNWGEVLEWVSGRIELPQWPPFDLAELIARAAEPKVSTGPRRPDSPVNLDPDIAEEWRDHYLRQTKKVRHAVDNWLNDCAEAPAPPPQEVDDETLSFAILTNLEVPEDRSYFNALFLGTKELRPATRAPTPMRKPRTDFLVKTGLSLQRLYRLQQVPRDAETAMYLIKNPGTHDVLVTISDINNSEWEILTSGRFDGFLWSGADGDESVTPTATESRGATPANGFFPPSRVGLQGGRATPGFAAAPGFATPGFNSRTTTPFRPYSRGGAATPASFVSMASSTYHSRQPVSNDEEAEIAALAELERSIFSGMEALEDAFEILHSKAEAVQTALRQRNAGLMQSMRSRQHIDVYGGLPGSGNPVGGAAEAPYWAMSEDGAAASDSDWGADDFDIKPEDSASNISSSRHRRPKRRMERRTPAPIEEDEEEGY